MTERSWAAHSVRMQDKQLAEVFRGRSAPDVDVDHRHADELLELAVVIHALPLVRNDPLHNIHCSRGEHAQAGHLAVNRVAAYEILLRDSA